jgi:poly(A) polymerase
MKPLNTNPKYQIALSIIRQLHKAGYEALIAGGAVRDMLIGRKNEGDIDIATNARPEEVIRLFPHTIAVGAKFGVIIIINNGHQFETATFRSDNGIADGRHPSGVVYTNAENDALRRDFTINGLFFDTTTHQVLDYVGGQVDIEARIIRAIGDPFHRFREDYLRMLRAIRFAVQLDFSIEKSTWNAIVQYAKKITAISVERIFTELDKMFRSLQPDRALELLDSAGLLRVLMPEVVAMKGVEQPKQFHPEGDVFEHTKKALKLMAGTTSSTLAWSVLLHDIGKPETKVVTDRIRFNNHDQVGALTARQILRRFHTSNLFIEKVSTCIIHHMHFMNVQKMRLGKLKKFLSRETIETELELHRIDCLASHQNCENYYFLKRQLQNSKTELLKPEPLLRGRDLIELGFKPGPQFSDILSTVYDAQLEETVSTRTEAIEFVTQHYQLN